MRKTIRKDEKEFHLLNIIGGKKAKKKTFGENPKKVASKVSSS